jgi:hypothetical protein
MNLTDFVAQIEKNYVAVVLRDVKGNPIIVTVDTPLANQYSVGGLVIAEMYAYSEFNGAAREPFKIGITYVSGNTGSYCLTSDGAAQLKARNEIAQTAIDNADPIFDNVAIAALPETVIKRKVASTAEVLP